MKKPERDVFRDGVAEMKFACRQAKAELGTTLANYGVLYQEFVAECLGELGKLWRWGKEKFFADEKGKEIKYLHAYLLKTAKNVLRNIAKGKKFDTVSLDDMPEEKLREVEHLLSELLSEKKEEDLDDEEKKETFRKWESYMSFDAKCKGWEWAKNQHTKLFDGDPNKDYNPMIEYLKRRPIFEIEKDGTRKVDKQALLCRMLWAFLGDENFRVLCSIFGEVEFKLPSWKKQCAAVQQAQVGNMKRINEGRAKHYGVEKVIQHEDIKIQDFDAEGNLIKEYTKKAPPAIEVDKEAKAAFEVAKLTDEEMARKLKISPQNFIRIYGKEKKFLKWLEDIRQLEEIFRGKLRLPEDTPNEVVHRMSENRKVYNMMTGVSFLSLKLAQMFWCMEQREYEKKLAQTAKDRSQIW